MCQSNIIVQKFKFQQKKIVCQLCPMSGLGNQLYLLNYCSLVTSIGTQGTTAIGHKKKIAWEEYRGQPNSSYDIFAQTQELGI
jgi:hypothetical protein